MEEGSIEMMDLTKQEMKHLELLKPFVQCAEKKGYKGVYALKEGMLQMEFWMLEVAQGKSVMAQNVQNLLREHYEASL